MTDTDRDARRPGLGLLPSIKYVAAVCASLGTLLPGVTYFSEHAPPMFDATGLLTTGVATVVLFWGFSHRPRRPLRVALVSVMAAFVLVVSYRIALDPLSVTPPEQRQGAARAQIGFGMARWSLTESTIKSLHELETQGQVARTPGRLMLMFGGWEGASRVRTIWRPWTVYTAGALLITLFVLGFLFWAYGFAVLARYSKDLTDGASSPAQSGAMGIRIAGLLSRPEGDQRQNEEVTLVNGGGIPVSLVGWTLRDAKNRTWKLDDLGIIAPSSTKSIRREGRSMPLVDRGGSVTLVDASGAEVHVVEYPALELGQVYAPPVDSKPSAESG